MAKKHPDRNDDAYDMGEIRAKVILTNALDEHLYLSKKLKKSAIRRYEADELIDTGALRSVIPPR